MTDAQLVPALVADLGEQASWRYVEFFTANIRYPKMLGRGFQPVGEIGARGRRNGPDRDEAVRGISSSGYARIGRYSSSSGNKYFRL